MRKHIPSERLSDEQYSDVIADYKPGAAKHMPPNFPPLPQVHAARRYSDAMREYGLVCWKAGTDELATALTELIHSVEMVSPGRCVAPITRARAALVKVTAKNGYQRTPQQEQELEILRSRGEL